MAYITKKKPDPEVMKVVKAMISLKVRGTRLRTIQVDDRFEIEMVWEDHDMEKEYNRLQEIMNELVRRKANRGTGQRNADKGHKRKA